MDEAYAIISLGDKLKDSNSFIRTKNEMPRSCRSEAFPFLYAYTIKPPAMLVVPLTALALDKKTSNDIISVGPKPHYI